MPLQIISTIAGLIILLAVLYRFIRPSPDAKTGFASLLTLIAFMLVAGPLWSSMTVKSEFFEVTLTKEAESQMKGYVKILNSYGRLAEAPDVGLQEAAQQLEASRQRVQEGIENKDTQIVLEGMRSGTQVVEKVASSLWKKKSEERKQTRMQ